MDRRGYCFNAFDSAKIYSFYRSHLQAQIKNMKIVFDGEMRDKENDFLNLLLFNIISLITLQNCFLYKPQ